MDSAIENIITRINKVDKIGLYYGKTGLAYFLQYLPDRKTIYKQLLSDIRNRLNFDEVDDFSFSYGLTGIGWAMQAMIECGNVDNTYVDIISKCDDLIYREVASNKSSSLSLFSSKGLLGKMLYFLQRFIAIKNRETNYNRAIANVECLVLLTTEIKDILSIIISNKKILELKYAHLTDIAQSFIILYLCFRINFNRNYIRPILQDIRNFIEEMIVKTDDINEANANYFLYLLYTYDWISHDMKESSMKSYSRKAALNLLPIIIPHLKNNTEAYLVIRYNKRNNTSIDLNTTQFSDRRDFYIWNYIPNLIDLEFSSSFSLNQNSLRMFLLE